MQLLHIKLQFIRMKFYHFVPNMYYFLFCGTYNKINCKTTNTFSDIQINHYE